MNVDEAIRCLGIANRHHDSGNLIDAIRFCEKALVLDPDSKSAQQKLERWKDQLKGGGATARPAPQPNGTASPRASTSKATPTPPVEKREYTAVQMALVKRVKSCKPTDYYGILELKKGCEDGEVKKAYRKLALGLHPDKCGAPGAEEAFKSEPTTTFHSPNEFPADSSSPKVVSKAFQILSDGNKRAIFDQTGGDPDVRGGGGGGGGGFAASPFQRGGGGGGGFGGQDISPEELFRMFFQGGQGGGGFGGGGPFGGGGFQTQFVFPQQQRARRDGTPATAGAAPAGNVWLQIAPLLFLFGFSLLTQLPSFFGSSSVADPDFTFSPAVARFTIPRMTNNMGVEYFVNARQFSQHPIYEAIVKANPVMGFSSTHEPKSSAYREDLFRHILKPNSIASTSSTPKLVIPTLLSKFEKSVERSYVMNLQSYCHQEIAQRNEQLERARGFLGIGRDVVKLKEITAARLEHCDKLSRLGYSVNY